MRAITLILLLLPGVWAQTITRTPSVFAASVPVQAKVDAPFVLTILAGERTTERVRVYHIVTPSADSRVRLYARLARPIEPGAITFKAAAWQSAATREGTLSSAWQEVAVSTGDVSQFSGNVEFAISGSSVAEDAAVILEWRYEVVTL
jgi:hypothetical protein